jgi:hypothetical protein
MPPSSGCSRNTLFPGKSGDADEILLSAVQDSPYIPTLEREQTINSHVELILAGKVGLAARVNFNTMKRNAPAAAVKKVAGHPPSVLLSSDAYIYESLHDKQLTEALCARNKAV